MIYIVRKTIEVDGKTFLPGQIVKLTADQFEKFKESVEAAKIFNKDLKSRNNG